MRRKSTEALPAPTARGFSTAKPDAFSETWMLPDEIIEEPVRFASNFEIELLVMETVSVIFRKMKFG